jgi:hypothetical protein
MRGRTAGGFKSLPKCLACLTGKGSSTTCRFKGVYNYILFTYFFFSLFSLNANLQVAAGSILICPHLLLSKKGKILAFQLFLADG